MWIFTILPNWLLPTVFFLSVVVYLVATTLKVLPYSITFKYLSIALIFLTVYLLGARWVDDHWRKMAQDLQLKVKELEAKSAEENVKIVEKVITKQQVVKEKGQNIIQYVDKVVVKDNEVIKYIEHCPKLPNEVVTTINKAAKP